ncbi:IgGFc-binding protein [Dryobates pubescens]|uniref:IgGFc-binding protein n=1 Tax=Dryobates pubescens TaxID=118200 RepID=UPI0023B8D29E|nr:IgGFc-binding protein [Dryobates pubescens]
MVFSLHSVEGYFIYQEASNLIPFDINRLESPETLVSEKICIDFWYYMFGSEDMNELRVIFEAVRGLTEYGDTALDNVRVRDGPCEAICSVYGDPHYYTFDNQRHDFMGTCTYTLSKLCESNGSLPYFNVEAANEHRGSNTRVSYVRYVDIDVYGYRINLGQKKVVKVDGVSQVLPVTLAQGVNISISGQYVVVATDFGLNVRFDGNHRVEITLPSTFMSKVCGMCGNYNGHKADDFLNPDGEMEENSASFGNSWQVYNDSRCLPDDGHTPNCTADEKLMIQSNEYCGLITDPNGPFQSCHSVVNPQSYSEACQYDLCELHLDNAALCENLQAYADVCQAAGVQLTPWRNATFCPLTCPTNSHYEPCAAACPATCADPMAPYTCKLPCVESCVCDSGYLLYNDRCVPSQQCGCWHKGQHYPVGSEFWTDNTCSSRCRCPARGSKVQCSSASCPEGQYCGVQDGQPQCLQESYGICHVHGDPHYNTFDKLTHNFMGNCTYTLAKVCSNTSSLPYFNVEAKNEHRGSPRVSYVREVQVEVYGQRVRMVKKEKSQVLVNNVRQTLPVSAAGGALTVSRSGRYIVLETDFKLQVSYDTDHSVEVKVPTAYFNLTCGMCGNFNNRKEDDYMMPSGQQAPDSNALGESWQVPDDDPSCGVPVPIPPCSSDKEELYQSQQFCGMLTASPGAFERCHGVINPQSYFETCSYDLCALGGGQEFLCAALEAYADACQAAGVTLAPWRNATFCPIMCPPNSHYNPCTSACPATCTDPLASENCSKPCVEGCECNNGFVISGGQCVSTSNCGCLQNGKYYEVNGVQVSLPVALNDGARVEKKGQYVVIDTSIGIQVKFDGDQELFILADESLKGQLCGLCGTFNDNQLDDFLTPDKVLEQDPNKFGDSWLVKDDSWMCNPVSVAPPTCDTAEEKEYEELCKVILKNSGPFEACHWHVPPQAYFESCVYDLCATEGSSEQYCKILEAYAAACELEGVNLGDWRKDTICDGYYIYLQGSDDSAGFVGQLVSPVCSSEGPHCFRFWYHMHGTAETMGLRVYVVKEDELVLVWERTGTHGDEWHLGEVTVHGTGDMQIILEGQWGEDIRSDVALDDLSIEQGSCAGDVTPTTPSTTTPSGTTPVPMPDSGTCVVEGDPHYHTFDNQLHNFMGTCTYTLSKLCQRDSSLPYFNVEAANEHRGGNTRVSYVRYVDVDVYGQRIRLGKAGVVTVNGVPEVLPCFPSAGVQVSFSGFYTVVTTDFGLRVKFDGNHRVEVTLPSTFGEKVCGMCGNYNGMAADDFLNPEGELEPDSTSLGNSWQVSNDSSCSAGPVPTPACNETDKQAIASSRFCGLLTDTSGPFKQCHAVLSPSAYFDTCSYDLCELGLDHEVLCKSLQSYVDACMSLGVKIPVWRNATFCPITCPTNSHYEPCAAACPATCADPMAPASCKLPCVEGCVCDSGYLLYNDRCVPSQQCGCWHKGQHYPVGSEFWTDNTCSSRCRCPARGSKVQCSSASCPEGQYCGVQDGQPQCLQESYGICHVHGDPHYNTFDKLTHNFMGNCTYTLAKVCSNTSSLPYFNVEAKNEHRGSPRVSYVREVQVEVYGQRVRMVKKEKSQVLVNNVRQTLPVSAAGGALTVSRSGRYIVLETDFKLQVSYDADHSVEVKVPTAYFNLTCGMCGNFNNRKEDDYMMPSGQQAPDSNALGESWQVPDDDPSCGVPVPIPPCSSDKEELYQSQQFCGMLTASPGAFERCHGVINPQSYFETCSYDLCALGGGQEFLCAALEAYADACQAAGVTLAPWRNATFCPLPCPANSYYDPCMTGCPATCADREAPQSCSKPCMEGCACTSGFLLSGDTCVPEARCGCLFEGNYYSEGEYSVSENCSRQCRCAANGQMVCSALSCAEDEVCKIQNGQRGCYPASTAVCHIYGDPHYSTFDGKLHHFQGSCNYTVVTGCDSSSVGFSLTTRNEHRGSQSWTALNSVALSMEGLHIALLKNKAVYINGAPALLPASPAPGVNVSLRGSYVQVSTKLGLQLQFDGDQELLVKVSEKHKGKLCGLCGTYTGSQQDDFMRPDGVVVPDFNEFGASWMVPDDEWPCDPAISPPASCSPSEEEAANKQCAILTQLSGPFQPCHAVLPPKTYFESCVYDQSFNTNTHGAFYNHYNTASKHPIHTNTHGAFDNHYNTASKHPINTNTYSSFYNHYNTASKYTINTKDHTQLRLFVTMLLDMTPTLLVHFHLASHSHLAPTPSTDCNFTCTFENDFCAWTQPDSNSIDWIRNKGPTPTPNTGPSSDHTTGDGYYIYLQGSDDSAGFVGQLVSPVCSSEGPHCFRFWYHMHGTAETMGLRVYVVKEDELVLVWERTGTHGDEWHLGEVTVHGTGDMQIILEGQWGEDIRSDVALDDLSIEQGSCAGDVTPTTPSTTTPSGTTPVPMPDSGTCVVEGDPHYHTFDNQLHNFMGTCTYTLSKLCQRDSSLPYFNVEAANEHRGGNTRVSYVRYVDVDVYGQRIRLGKAGVVTVNGVPEVLPCFPSAGVQVSFSGFYTVVTTDFGLRVKFDGNHRVEVTLPSTFGEKVCGMCGNYNGMAADDFLNPEGELEPDSTSLGNSWQVSNDSSCSAGPVPTPACNETDKQAIASSRFCGLLTDTSGPFKQCHAVLSPSAYFDTCSYDLCELGLDHEVLCKSLQSYVDACMSLGVKIPVWRNATFCPITCPTNSHYEPCAAACPATCADPMAPASCKLPCVEGCVCDSGYLLYNDRCVPSQQCGCWHKGQHYPVGSEFWTDNTCSSRCRCPARGSKVQCSSASCPEGQYCGVQDGQPQCLQESYGICHVHGDPHYNTFDKLTHNFMGNCTYTLAKVCSNTSSLPYFNVEAKNEHRGSPRVSYVREVQVEVYGQRVRMVKKEKSQVLVNNVRQTLPVSAAGGALTVSRSGRYIVLETDFKLQVSYDADHSVEVKVPTAYFNLTCGMCGNFNNRKEDDYMMPSGQQAPDSNALGESWQVPDDDPSCGVPVPIPPCSSDKEELYQSQQFCGMLTASPGAFERCHGVINPQSYFETCSYDLCALGGGQEFLCAALEAYADACQAAGVTLAPWRNATFCPLPCPANSYYDPCMTGCPATCADREAPQSCSKPCMEGCACTSGFLLSGDTCVPEARCGCLFEGNYYSEGEYSVSENCSRQCRCAANGQMVCSALSCAEDEVCKIQNGQRGCYPASTAVCHIYGDPHYSTFDGKLHHFQGSCNYTVVTGCDSSSVGFSLTTRNEHRGSQSWTALNSVALSMEGLHIALLKNKAVYINGAPALLPASPAPGVNVSLRGSYVQVSTKLGLQLQFDGDQELLVKVSEKHKGKLCGLCGTYTGSQQDDFMRPDGVVVPDFNEFGASWMVPDDEWPCDPAISPPASCSPSEEEAANKQCAILTQLSGPFQPCHVVLPPKTYFESCVYDQSFNTNTHGAFYNHYNTASKHPIHTNTHGAFDNHYNTASKHPINTNTYSSFYNHYNTASKYTINTKDHTQLRLFVTMLLDMTPTLLVHFHLASHSHLAPTPSTDCNFTCTFENDFCAWTQPDSNSIDWIRNKGPTPTPNTGPSSDHTTGDGYYIYLQGSDDSAGFVGQLVSPVCSSEGPHCFRFWYHMHGTAETMGLRVYVVKEDELVLVWERTGTHGDEWHLGEVTVHGTGDMQIILEGQWGEDIRSDVALDDLSVNTKTHGPYNKHYDAAFQHTINTSTHSPLYNHYYTASKHTINTNTYSPLYDHYNTASKHTINADIHSPPYKHYNTASKHTINTNTHSPPYKHYNTASKHTINTDTHSPSYKHYNTASKHTIHTDTHSPPYKHYNTASKHTINTDTHSPPYKHYNTASKHTINTNTHSALYNHYNAASTSTINTKTNTQLSASGDPHYNTFDHRVHNFMGNCTYTLSKVCNVSERVPYFDVSTTNEHRGANTRVSYVKSVQVEVYGNQISLLKNKKVNVNGRRVNLPVFIEEKISIQSSGGYVLVETDFGLWVRYDGNHYAEVSVPSNYSGLLCGLCGNYNGDPNDDNIKPSGDIASGSNDLGQSWLVPDGNSWCSTGTEEQCDPVLENEAKKNTACGMITDPTGSMLEVPCQAICQVAGDPHYLTFDGRMYTFMGTCTYTLVEVVNTNSATPITIRGKNEDRGLRGATYLKEVYIDVYGIRITLQKNQGILLNNERVNTPLENRVRGVSVGSVGRFIVVETDFGVIVKFDGNHHLEITLPQTYFSKVQGMCGNFNDNREDELVLPNGTLVGVTDFGNSWKVEADSDEGCLSDSREDDVPPCTAANKPDIERQCNVLKSDKFKACHNLVNPEDFIQMCVYDMCLYDGMKSALCDIVQVYVDTCRSHGITIKWRNSTFCPLSCPPHNHYTDCVSACPSTCNDIFASSLCEKTEECTEGCECDDNYVLSNGKCVPLSNCGCRDDDNNYYSAGETWITPHCTRRCECQKNGVIKCKSYSCDSGETCVIKNGKHKCNPTGFGKCRILGDPHYTTFDGLVHHFQGRYTYIMAQTIPGLPDTLTPFRIEGTNYPFRLRPHLTYLREVLVDVYNHTVRFMQNKKLVVDGVKVRPPAHPHEGIRIYQRTTRIYLETDFGLYLSFDGSQNADIKLANTYRSRVEGLCGDFDGRPRNDFKNPNGVVYRSVNMFGASWKVPLNRNPARLRRDVNSDDEFEEELDTGLFQGCGEKELEQQNGNSRCQILMDSNGPFANCHSTLSPDFYFMSCLFDMCAIGDDAALCQSLEEYVLACQQQGVSMGGWRQQTVCGISCPANSNYSLCTSACPASCNDFTSPSECESPCVEGCECLPGYVLSDSDCVPYKECGCTYLDKYYEMGEIFITDDCSQRCQCTESSTVSCTALGCESGEICGISNFSRGCYRSGPCMPNPCKNDGVCSEDTNNSSVPFSCECSELYTGPVCADERIAEDPSTGNAEHSTVAIVLAVVAGVAVIIILTASAVVMLRDKRNSGTLEIEGGSSLQRSRDALDGRVQEQDYGYVTNAAFDDNES